MKLFFMCGYNPDAAQDAAAYPPAYRDAIHFCHAVRSGQFKESFYIHTKSDRILVTKSNIGLARRAFGRFIAKRIEEEGSWTNPLLVPVPSEDALIDAKEFRSWIMASEALAMIELKWALVDALLWAEPPPPSTQKAETRRRDAIAGRMTCDFPMRGQAIVLIDDLVSTGATLLAARDRLRAEGAVVLGAIACGRVILDSEADAFGRQEIWLEDEVEQVHR